ncbi:MAG: hypothetical protein MI924_15985, partial [Chloroflexales bacterium]|nr:hypothetical protein [Chloroflexales bacterium]
ETPSATSDSEEIPAWLRDADRETPSATSDSEEIPAWLRDADRETATPSSPSEGSAIPAWLQSADAEPSVAPQPPEASDAMPAWLRDATEEQNEQNEQPASPANEDVSEWLKGDAPASPGLPASLEPSAMPSWLETPSSESEQAPASPDLPPWLASEREGSGLPRTAANDESLPLWLRGADREAIVPEQSSTGFSGEKDVAAPSSSPPPEEAKPSRWASSAEPPAPRTKRDDEDSGDFFGSADLPDWLRLPEPETAVQTEETQALDWLSRLGIQDDDSEEAVVATATSVAVLPRPTYTRSPAQQEAIALLQRLVAAPYPETAPKAKPAPLSVWERIGLERILYVVLIVVVLAGIAFPQLSSTLQTATPMASGASDLAAAIERLSDEDVVLLAYEWDAERSSELAPLEDAVAAHLIERKAKLLLVSTDPQGALLSFDLRDELQAAGYNPTIDGVSLGGRDYVLLGYRPGGELALRRMAQDLRAVLRSDFEGRDATLSGLATNFDGTPRLSTLDDLAMIVVMADQPLDVQAWMEQIHSRATQVPIAFLIPSETQPLVQPYLRGANVLHLAGKQGALAYTAQGNTATTASIAQDTGRQNFAIAAFVALLIVGAGIGALLRMRRSPRSE